MERVTVRLPKRQLREVEALVEDGEFPNRSEAIRSAIRGLVEDKKRIETKTETKTKTKTQGNRRLTARKL